MDNNRTTPTGKDTTNSKGMVNQEGMVNREGTVSKGLDIKLDSVKDKPMQSNRSEVTDASVPARPMIMETGREI